MSAKLEESIYQNILAEAQSDGKVLGVEEREHVQKLAIASADLTMRSLAGENVDQQREVVKARALNLVAAGIIGSARIAAEATQSATLGIIKFGFGLLGAIT